MIGSPFRKIRYPASSDALSTQVTLNVIVPPLQKKLYSTIPGWRGGAPVARAAVSYRRNEPAEVWLAPGDYTAVAELGTLRGSASFTVGTVGGEVRITLR